MERPPAPKSWYLVWAGKSVGPWPTETVLEHLADRKLKGTDKIIGEGESQWREIREDPIFGKSLKRKPRRKEKLTKPRSIQELIQKRKEAKRVSAETKATTNEKIVVPPKEYKRRNYMPLLIVLGFSALIGLGLLAVPRNPPQKTKGLEEINPPNPPGPATKAPEESDPNSLPKPPTRPQRP